MKKIFSLASFRTIALIVVFAGAIGSLYLMFNAGRHQRSILLIVLFTVWVLSPFIALLVSDLLAKHWPVYTRVRLYFLMLFITFGSLVCYSGALNVSGTKPAFKFLIVPLVSWLLIALIIPVSRKLSAKRSG